MRGYLALSRTTMRSLLAYPLSFALGQFAVLFQLLAMLSIWGVLLASGRDVGGYTWQEMKAYLLVAFVTGILLTAFGERGMPWRIREGSVATDLTKPLDFQHARFAECLGGTVVEATASALVITAVVLLTGALPVPGGAGAALFVLSLLVVIPIKFCVLYGTALLCFWTQNFIGLMMARTAIVSLFSGALVPLAFLPPALQSLAAVLPFASITSTPALIYLGRAEGFDALRLIGMQLIWAIVLWTGARLFWRAAVRQLTVHGG